MKKILTFIILIFSLFLGNQIIIAESFDDLTLEQMEKNYADALANYNANSAAIAANETKINESQIRIGVLENQIAKTKDAIVKSEIDIANKGIEIEDMKAKIILSTQLFQRMDLTNIYLEYLINSESFNDFSRKTDNAKLLIDYQNNLVTSFKDSKKELETLNQELVTSKKSLEDDKAEASKLIADLKAQNVEITDERLGAKTQMDIATQAMEAARSLNCSTTETYKECVQRQLVVNPPAPETGGGSGGLFRRPTSSGTVTSEFGPRFLAGMSYHYGMDTSGSGSNFGSSVYLPASGQIIATGFDSCGGNYIKAIYNVGGTNYTTTMYHLSAIYVSSGSMVDSDTVVGAVGNTGACTTGAHLHLEVSQMLYNGSNFAEYRANLINPRSVINYPGLDESFSGR